jgi:paraquat-inducible protein B
MKKGKQFMANRHYNTPKIKESRGIQLLTTVWMVPFIALVVALWLVYQHYSKVGPTIEISFKSNAGLVANQSQIKMRDVTVGMVKQISLSKDGKGVTVQASINKEVAPYLNEKAKIWIVHPDVGSHGVSGLDTLLSGSYIKIHGIKEKETKHKFIGLEDPYIDNEAKGKYYKLSAPTSNDVSEGSNIYYRQVKIGRVERVEIAPTGKQVNFTIFVEEKYTKFINKKSQFYTRSNFAMDFSQGKLDFSIAGVSQIVRGGISIYTPSYSINNHVYDINREHIFPVYKSLAEMKAKHLMTGAEDKVYKFLFEEDITKLEINSPIEFQGFRVGYVIDIDSHFKESNQSIHSEVYAIIHTKAFGNHQTQTKGERVIETLVKDGLKAKLDTHLPIIGAQFVNLVFDQNTTAMLSEKESYTLFPTTQQKKETGIMDEVKKLIVKLEKLPLEQLLTSATKLIDETNPNMQKVLKDLDKTIQNIEILTNNKSLHQLPKDLSQTIQTLETTLMEFQNFAQGYNANSKFSAELSLTLKELSLAAESIERVSRKLEKKPNALLLGDD